jgi:hypothetical protein
MLDHAGEPQHLQMMTERGIGDVAMECARPPLAAAGQLAHDAEPDRIAQRPQHASQGEIPCAWMLQLLHDRFAPIFFDVRRL